MLWFFVESDPGDQRMGSLSARQGLCIPGRVFLPAQWMLLAEPGRDVGNHDLILDHASERWSSETKTSSDPKLSQDLKGHRKQSQPSTGISFSGWIQTIFLWVSLKRSERVGRDISWRPSSMPGVEKVSGLFPPILGSRCYWYIPILQTRNQRHSGGSSVPQATQLRFQGLSPESKVKAFLFIFPFFSFLFFSFFFAF